MNRNLAFWIAFCRRSSHAERNRRNEGCERSYRSPPGLLTKLRSQEEAAHAAPAQD